MNLVDTMRIESGRSKVWFRWGLSVSFALYLIALVSSYSRAKWLAILLGIVSSAGQIAHFIFKSLSAGHFSLAEEIRRLAMLQDGLGVSPSKIQIAKLRERVGKSKTLEPDYLGPYYESLSPPGPRRLLEITEESAFFTSCLARTTSKTFGVVAALGLGIVLFGFIVLVQIGLERTAIESVAKAVVLSMAFWAVGDLASMALQFHSLSRSAEGAVDRCSFLLAQASTSGDQAQALVGEYNCAVIQAPPIPSLIYKWRRDILNEAWRQRQSEDKAS